MTFVEKFVKRFRFCEDTRETAILFFFCFFQRENLRDIVTREIYKFIIVARQPLDGDYEAARRKSSLRLIAKPANRQKRIVVTCTNYISRSLKRRALPRNEDSSGCCCCRRCRNIDRDRRVIAAHKGRCFAERLRRVLAPDLRGRLTRIPPETGQSLNWITGDAKHQEFERRGTPTPSSLLRCRLSGAV